MSLGSVLREDGERTCEEEEGGRGGCNTKKTVLERGSGVDRKFDILNCCSGGRSETADAKISSKRNRFDIHMLDLEVG
jgi:hypothetical protein